MPYTFRGKTMELLIRELSVWELDQLRDNLNKQTISSLGGFSTVSKIFLSIAQLREIKVEEEKARGEYD